MVLLVFGGYLLTKILSRFVFRQVSNEEEMHFVARMVKKLEKKFEYTIIIAVGQYLILNFTVYSMLQLMNSACQYEIQFVSFISSYLFFGAVFFYLGSLKLGLDQYMKKGYRSFKEGVYQKYQYILA